MYNAYYRVSRIPLYIFKSHVHFRDNLHIYEYTHIHGWNTIASDITYTVNVEVKKILGEGCGMLVLYVCKELPS